MNEKIGMYTEDEILEHLTEGEGRGFLGRSMYDAIFDKIHALKTENEQLKKQVDEYKKLGFKYLQDKNNNLETQQKEFIKYLNDKINKLVKEYGNYVYDDYSEEKGKYDTYIEILQKYKSIIGVSDDKTN